MNADRDVTRIVRSWLRSDEHESADRVLDAVLDQLDTTPQRRAHWLGWRSQPMNQAMRITLAAAAVVAVALIGITYLRAQNTGGPGLGDPSPTATPMPFPVDGFAPLQPGRYVAGDPFPARLTLTVGGGWEGNIGGPYAVFIERPDPSAWLELVVFDDVATDPCQSQEFRAAGPTVEDLATALAAMPGVTVTEVGDITVDGYAGRQLLVTAPDSFAGCTLGQDGYVLWRLPLGAQHSMGAGERHRVWILDVDGQRIVVSFPEPPQVTPAEEGEIQAIVDSLTIDAGG